MEEEEYRRMSTTTIYHDDLPRLNELKRKKTNRRKWEPSTENNADVIGRALDALEALEKTRVS